MLVIGKYSRGGEIVKPALLAVMAASLMFCRSASAQENPLYQGFTQCLQAAIAGATLSDPMTDRADKLARFHCDGPEAGVLFAAMEFVARQEFNAPDPSIVWRRTGGVQCARIPGPPIGYHCGIEIDVGRPFLEALTKR